MIATNVWKRADKWIEKELMAMLRPVTFRCKKPRDPEQLLQDFMLYKTMMAKFLLATAAAGQHTKDCAQCTACPKTKSMVKLIGGLQMVKLFDHVGVVRRMTVMTRL